jgi:cytochrome b
VTPFEESDGGLPLGRDEVLVWDLPTRLFKWSLVLLIVLAWVSNRYGGGMPMWHKANGYAILVLIVFRILWGIVGGSTARFANFVSGPRATFDYIRGVSRSEHRFLGHNPLGGWMVLTLLAIVGAQAILGLYSADQDRLIIEGPLAKTVSDAAVDRAAHLHRSIFNLLVVLSCIHIAANLFYDSVKKTGLIKAMIVGRKRRATYVDRAQNRPGRMWVAVLCLLAAIAIVFGSIVLMGGDAFR